MTNVFNVSGVKKLLGMGFQKINQLQNQHTNHNVSNRFIT